MNFSKQVNVKNGQGMLFNMENPFEFLISTKIFSKNEYRNIV